MIKAVIFDVDGVIIESAKIKTRAFEQLFANYPEELPRIIDYHERNAGISRYVKFQYIYEEILGKTLLVEEEAELGKRFSDIVLDEILKVPFVPGAVDFLKRNKERYYFFIASGTPQEELQNIIACRGITHLFLEIHGTPKQKEQIIEDILTRHALPKEEVVFVGDAESDRDSAEKTGVGFIARTSGESHLLQDCRWKIGDLTELDSVLENIYN